MSEERSILLERSFYVEGEEANGPAVIIRLLGPYQREGDYPFCRFELVAGTSVTQKEVSGLDGLNCINTCLSVIGSTVAGWNESIFAGRLRWEGSPEGCLGLDLPKIEDRAEYQKPRTQT